MKMQATCIFKYKYAVKVWQLLKMEDCGAVLANKQSAEEVIPHIITVKEEEQMRVIVLLLAMVA